MKPLRSAFLLTLVSLVSVVSTGCVAVVAGGAAAGGTAYALGDLKTTIVDSSASEIQSAIVKGGRDLGLRSISGSGDELEGQYIFRTAADEKITVSYKSRGSGLTEMRIRVGTFGDEVLSNRINQAVRKHL